MSSKKINVAILISGRGSNMQALIDACKNDKFPARVSVVASNSSSAKGLEIAKNAGIATVALNHKDFDTRAAFENNLLSALKEFPIDVVCLAGFMRVLSPVFINAWPSGRMLNIHPSLLPTYKGLDTHARAISDGASQAGCTVHEVVAELDSGKTIVQRKVKILENDTPQTLAGRVLEEEHKAYPKALEIIANKVLKEKS